MAQITLNLLQAKLTHMDSYNGSTDVKENTGGAKPSAEIDHKSSSSLVLNKTRAKSNLSLWELQTWVNRQVLNNQKTPSSYSLCKSNISHTILAYRDEDLGRVSQLTLILTTLDLPVLLILLVVFFPLSPWPFLPQYTPGLAASANSFKMLSLQDLSISGA